ncbi:MAG TPA: hypothetical protein PKH07_14745, partial [bacterium]|nr:hypothetical protein [bacterium]
VVLRQAVGFGVPIDSVVSRRGKDVIFIAEQNRARMVPVELGLRTERMVQVISDILSPGMQVVIQGQKFCEEGTLLRVVQEAK